MSSVTIIMQIIFIIGLLFVIINLVKTYNPCPAPKVIYRYVPRTFIEEQENPVPLDDIFYAMLCKMSLNSSAINILKPAFYF